MPWKESESIASMRTGESLYDILYYDANNFYNVPRGTVLVS